MNKLVFINQSTGYLTIDTVNAYASKFDEVVLITGRIGEAERKLNTSIKVKKIVAYDKSSLIRRVLTWVAAFFQIFFLLAFRYRKYEVVYVTNPPLSYLASLILRNPFSIIIYDAYPDALRNIGIKQGHWLYELWSRWNRKLFKKANNIYTLSKGMARQLANYVEQEKIKVVPLWPSSESFSPIDKQDNKFIKEHHLEDKFIVMYSGNMGYTHNVDILIEVATILKDVDGIQFLFVGNGKKKSDMLDTVKQRKLANCIFLDWQPYDILPYSLAAADLGVVSLNEETALTSVPSKTFNLLATGVPLLCIAPKESEISHIVSKYENGKVCTSTEVQNMADFILMLSNNKDLHKRMSISSLDAAKEYTKENAYLYLS